MAARSRPSAVASSSEIRAQSVTWAAEVSTPCMQCLVSSLYYSGLQPPLLGVARLGEVSAVLGLELGPDPVRLARAAELHGSGSVRGRGLGLGPGPGLMG